LRYWVLRVKTVVVMLLGASNFPQTTFKGRVFMTHATKAIYKLLLTDYVKVSKVSVEDMLYNENDIARSMEKSEVCYVFVCACFSFRGKVIASGFFFLRR